MSALENFQKDIDELRAMAMRMMARGVLTANRDADIAKSKGHGEMTNIGKASGELFDGGKSLLLAANFLDIREITNALLAIEGEPEPNLTDDEIDEALDFSFDEDAEDQSCTCHCNCQDGCDPEEDEDFESLAGFKNLNEQFAEFRERMDYKRSQGLACNFWDENTGREIDGREIEKEYQEQMRESRVKELQQ